MANKRESDPSERTWFRTKRMFKEGDSWYFYTRENTIEGPYPSEAHAEVQLKIYIRLQNPSSQANDNGLELMPLDTYKPT